MSNNKLIIFLLNPCISAIGSFLNIKQRGSQTTLYLWFVTFGIGFCALSDSADSYRYVDDFLKESNYSFDQYWSLIREYFTFTSNIKDIYSLTMNFLVGRISSNYHVLFFFYALVFGYFYINSLKFILRYKCDDKIMFCLLLFIFCFSNPIFNINGARFWTASWIAVYSFLKIIIDNKYRYILLLLVTPLIHNDFSFWILAVAVSLFTGRFSLIWIILFVVSSFVSSLNYIDFFSNYSGYLPVFLQNQFNTYTEIEEMLSRAAVYDAMPLYAKVLDALPKYFTLLLSYILIFNKSSIEDNKESQNLYRCYFVFATIFNFTSGIPSMSRFQYVIVPLLVLIWIQNYSLLKQYNNLFYYVPLIYCYVFLYWWRNMMSVTEIWLYFFPAPVTFYYYLFT